LKLSILYNSRSTLGGLVSRLNYATKPELVASGALIQKGKSYYLGNKDLLPKYVSRKIKSMEQNRNGIKVTFRK
ncbi:hypothetical protein V3H47_24395, partial [Vibrio parahaemolyticus]|uniref:hypothetical protein n=1 Tax=Vibrio parahaemolyticus TaxID=670 RepID=UPI003B678354